MSDKEPFGDPLRDLESDLLDTESPEPPEQRRLQDLVEPVLGDQATLGDWQDRLVPEESDENAAAWKAQDADEPGWPLAAELLVLPEETLDGDPAALHADRRFDDPAWIQPTLLKEEPSSADDEPPRDLAAENYELQSFPEGDSEEGPPLTEPLSLPDLPPIDSDATDAGLTLSLKDIGETDLPEDEAFSWPEELRFRLFATAEGDFEGVTTSPLGPLVASSKVYRFFEGELKEATSLSHRVASLVSCGPNLLLTTRAGHWYRATLDPADPTLDDLEQFLPDLPARGATTPFSLSARGDRVVAYDGQGAAFELDRKGRALGVAEGAFRSALRLPCGVAFAAEWTVVVNARQGLWVLGPALSDGVRMFQIAGCGGARGLCLGRVQDQLLAWTTLSEVGGETRVIEIDVESKTAVCVFRVPRVPHQDELLVSALAWDASSCTLLIASNGGFFALKRLEG